MLEIFIFLIIIIIFGVVPMIIYLKQENKISKYSKFYVIFVIITMLIIFINIYLAIVMSQGSIGIVLGKVFFLPSIIIGLFSLSKKSRNWKSRFNILFYTGLIILISLLGNLVQSVSEVLP